MQIKGGYGEHALHTAKLILTSREMHLPQIADALVDVGDKDHFKRLLIPCACYLDAAYLMCGLLARVYPEQASAIAKIVKE